MIVSFTLANDSRTRYVGRHCGVLFHTPDMTAVGAFPDHEMNEVMGWVSALGPVNVLYGNPASRMCG